MKILLHTLLKQSIAHQIQAVISAKCGFPISKFQGLYFCMNVAHVFLTAFPFVLIFEIADLVGLVGAEANLALLIKNGVPYYTWKYFLLFFHIIFHFRLKI